MVLPSPTSSQSMARPRNRLRTVLAVRIWCSSSSMSRTIGRAIRRSKPECVAKRAAWIARSNCSRPAGAGLTPSTTGQSAASKSMGTPWSVTTAPSTGCGAPGSTISRNRPGARYSSQSAGAADRETASPSFGSMSEPVARSSVSSSGRPAGSSTCSMGNPSGPRILGRLSRPVEPIGSTSNRSPGSNSAPGKTEG